MNQKLFEKSPDFYFGVCRFLNQKSIIGRLCLIVILSFISTAGFAQLATQDFEGGIPSDWAPINNGTGIGTTPWTISADGYMSSGAAFIDPSAENIGNGNTVQYFLVTPLITVPANGQLRFFTKQSSETDYGNVYQIRISTASQTDASSFTTLLTSWTESELNTVSPLGYEEKVVNLPSSIAPGIGIYVAFVLVNNQDAATPNADTWFIDDVSLQTAQVCDPVLAGDFTITSVTSDSATLSWTHPTATQFQILVLPTGDTPPATGIATGNTYIAPNLAANTTYDVYIKTICSQSTSAWAGPFELNTVAVGSACSNPIIIPTTGAPYVFSGNLDTFQNAAVTYPSQGTNCLSPAVTGNYLEGAKAFFSYTPTQDGLITITQVTNSTGWNFISGVFVYDGCTNVGVTCLGGLNTSESDVPKQIPNLYVEAGHTYIIVVSSVLSADASIGFTLKVETAPCAPPAVFTYKNLLQDSIQLSWNNVGDFASAWEYVVLPAGSPAPTGAGTATATNVDNIINTGLVAGTAYDFYVRSVCSSVPGNWSDPFKFTTQCAVFNTPYTESFDGASSSSPTPCWLPLDINGDGNTWKYSWENIMISTGNSPGMNNDMMVTPMINLGTTPKRLRFKYQTSGGISRYSVVVSTTGIGADNFTTVILPTQSVDTNYDVFEKFVNIPASITGNVNIAFFVDAGTDETAYSFILDDIIVEDKPACPDHVALTADAITTATASLSWEAGDVESQWQIVVQPKDSGIPTVDGTLVSSNTYSATGLTHATQYEYYVRAYCSSTQQSNWVGPFYFTTLCSVFDTPFFENFNDNDATTHKSCWSINDLNGDGAQWNMNATQPAIQGNPFFGTPEYDDWLISPAINVVGTKALKFKYKSAFSFFFPNPRFGVEVLMSTTDTDPASFSVVMPLIEFTNTDYIEKTVYINANGPVYIAFRVPPSFSTADGTSILQIDDVSIVDAPACPAPDELKATGITQTSAVLSWTKGYTETQWNVVVQPAGTGVPTVAGNLATSNTAYPSGTLLPNTQYEYYVRAFCNSTDQSEWVGPFVFTTLCDAFTTPFTETFNPDSQSEECWRVLNSNSDSFTWTLNSTTDPYEGDQAAGIFTGTNGANNDWLISPTITITAGQRLRYYYRVLSSDFYEDIDVKLSTTGIDPENFTTVLYTADYFDVPPLNNTEWKEKVINLPAGVTGNVNIAWHIPEKEANPWNYRGQLLVIDKVIIEPIPACSAPTNLAVQTIIDTEAQLSWDSTGTETSWDIYVQPAGLTAPVGDGDAQFLHTTSTNPYTVTGLTAATKYDYYVRAACGTADSEWIGPLEFTTRCSFENLCEYKITLSNPAPFGDISGAINLIQNEVVVQSLQLTDQTEDGSTQEFLVYLCDGVEFSLFWDSIGWVPNPGDQSTITIQNQAGDIIWASPEGIGTQRTTVYTGVVSCSAVTCPAPTNLVVNSTGVLSWTAGGTESQWEVFIQPVSNGTLPQSGTLVSTNSYTPQASDFASLTAGTYEFFVRAVCGTDNTSYWSGAHKFVRNDDASKAITLPVNSGEVCIQSASAATFIGATPSAEPMSCTGINGGDIWFEFQAASKVHEIELSNFSGDLNYSGGNPPHALITMTLYKVTGTTLQEVACTYNNVVVAAYSSELEVGATYKLRLTLNDVIPNAYTFDVCVTTPADPCKLNTFNSGFETPDAATGGLTNFYTQRVVPGWRNNFTESDTSLYEVFFFVDALNTMGLTPYEGGQSVQLITSEVAYDPSDLNDIKGTFQDFDSSEITKFDYSFAHAARSQDSYLQLYAGPPTGPFVLLEEHLGTIAWNFYEGQYSVPEGQNVTRFIFRSKDNMIGNILDAANFVANNALVTQPITLNCQQTDVTLEAEGKGTWVADENNPGAVVITTPNSKTTTVTGFASPGEYKFYWRTRYCEYSVVITKQGIDVVPVVVTPVSYCQDAVAQLLTAPALDGYTQVWYDVATGGTALTAVPTPDTATAGTTSYYVAYINADGCEGERAKIDVIVTEKTVIVTGFEYDEESYCNATQNPVITLEAGFTPNGIFTATPQGLSINASTGAIDLAASTEGTYEVTYTVEADAAICSEGGSHTVTVTISGSLDAKISQECRDNNVWLVVSPVDSSFDPEKVSYTWKNETGETVETNTSEFNVSEYFALKGNPELPLNFTVTISSGACTNEVTYSVLSLMCDVPRGISPNGDNMNDELDLTGFGISHITIFNRYGKEVYSHGGNYTNQWHGQDKKDNDLPDGTYFYSIEKTGGSNITGWIYINRQY